MSTQEVEASREAQVAKVKKLILASRAVRAAKVELDSLVVQRKTLGKNIKGKEEDFEKAIVALSDATVDVVIEAS